MKFTLQTLAETSCELERQMAKTMDDAFVPDCKQDGSYSEVQCFEHEGFAKQCWCVTSDGQEVKGTRMSDGQTPNCNPTVSVKESYQEQPMKLEHHNEPVKAKEELPSQNQTTTEIELQIFRNDTGRLMERWLTLNVSEMRQL